MNIPNIVKETLSADQNHFVEDVASLLVPWGMPQTAARLYGCLLLNAEPISLDHIAVSLDVSKSSASVAARRLEKYNMARRIGTRGSKRVLYAIPDNFSGLLAEQGAILGKMGSLLQSGAGAVVAGSAADRMQSMAHFYLGMQSAIATALQELAKKHSS